MAIQAFEYEFTPSCFASLLNQQGGPGLHCENQTDRDSGNIMPLPDMLFEIDVTLKY
jgi:hypothetical protein